MKKYPIILGVKGKSITKNEEEFLKKCMPLGIILFRRNIENKSQVKLLIASIKKIIGRKALILVDQEGGKVSRLNSQHWPEYPTSEYFGKLALKNLKIAKKRTYENYFSIGKELYNLGFNYNCAPVVDIRFKKANEIIGSRAFSADPKIVTILAKEACKGLLDANIFPILKHIPGHGRAREDSHLKLPIINSPLTSLINKDFYPFIKMKNLHAAMTAHIKFSSIDSVNCVTHSKKIISLIRKKIGFNGIIFSDDICMKALKGNYFNRAKLAVEAGCDLILKCDYNLNTSYRASKGAGLADKKLLKKIYK